MALLWVLNLSDGTHSLLDIAERAKLPFAIIDAAARLLAEHELVVSAEDGADALLPLAG
jgi:aminopeptidase-like protein